MTQVIERPVADETGFDFDGLLELTRPSAPVKLKLSEAIRLGAARTRPADGIWEKVEGEVWACAMGAACYAAAGYKSTGVNSINEAAEYFPELIQEVTITDAQVPELRQLYSTTPSYEPIIVRWLLGEHIMLFNDSLHLPRTRTADIVEALGY